MHVTFAVGFMMRNWAVVNAVLPPAQSLKIYPMILLALFAALARTSSLKNKTLTLAFAKVILV